MLAGGRVEEPREIDLGSVGEGPIQRVGLQRDVLGPEGRAQERCAQGSDEDATMYGAARMTAGCVHAGSLPGFHLMLQPTLGFWLFGMGWPFRTASSAARTSRPVNGTSLPGRLSSNCPR